MPWVRVVLVNYQAGPVLAETLDALARQTDGDFEAVAQRLVAAAERMRDDAWWWSCPSLDDKAIKRLVLREIVAARLRQLV